VKVVLAVGLALALSPALHAQDGLRSASLPERPIATQPPGPHDLYRAGPNTYRPRSERETARLKPGTTRPPERETARLKPGTTRPPERETARLLPGTTKRPRLEPPLIDRGDRGLRRYPEYLTGYSYWPYPETPVPEMARNQSDSVGVGFLQLRISPADALVYVDGILEGTAADLRWPGSSLRPGTHRVRLEATGYQVLTFDVRITDGQTVSFSQVLDRATALPSRAVSPDPVVAKTMYVIPRCYAGDKPPDASSGCDLTKLRTIR
jgi:hypothetical protein